MLTTHPTYLIPTFEAVSSVLFVAGIGVLVTIRLGRYLRPPSHSVGTRCWHLAKPPSSPVLWSTGLSS